MLQCRHAQEFSFGPRALKDALISTDPVLQELYAKAFTSAEKLFLSEAYNPHRTLFCGLFIRTAFDWLLSHPDAPEDFETFYYSLLRRKQRFCRKHIYLQPIDLSEGPAGICLLNSLQSCVESFFFGLRVKCLPSVPVSSIHCCYRNQEDSDRVQLHTDGILTFLKNNKPMDALCVLGLTLVDLYPCETWSFTFGKFLPGQEVGVCSFARFSGDFSQVGCTTLNPSPRGQQGESETTERTMNQTLLFNMLEMLQCCKCIMQGALSLDEVLLRPLEPCPICLRKLQYVVGFKLIERYRKLYAWTQNILATWPSQEATDLSVTEDTLPYSADSGMGCENDSEAVTTFSEPLTPDTCSQAVSTLQELDLDEQSCALTDASSQEKLGGAPKPLDIIKEYILWLEMCIAALEKDVTEEELLQVDKAVDALERWEMFGGQLPAVRRDLPFSSDSPGLRKVLGDKFSSLRRKLSSRKTARMESSPHRWRWEES
ncbi:archaemetzincin-1 isoform X2 [Eublepharis macularius]|uniref:Archaemetzincin-1 isoform X2 n=1 Tax=Eublepharis macularius TaxID=481883 RepID=A0AA97K8Y0_EUBMA|nr:archaemetzincin-1 isoform X2 [Eublepharis macularius]